MMKKYGIVVLFLCYVVFIAVSVITGFDPGRNIGSTFLDYCIGMAKILPCAFILIGLFEVWVKREMIEKHLGSGAGPKGYFWAIVLGGVTIGMMIVALPLGQTLYRKGASLKVVLAYLGAAAICRIPMTIFEASYLGIKFTLIRYAVSIPLIILTAAIYGTYLERKNFVFNK